MEDSDPSAHQLSYITEERIQEFMLHSKETQQMFFDLFSDRDWDTFEDENNELLKLKIAFALDGPPTTNGADNFFESYSSEQQKAVMAIYNKIYSADAENKSGCEKIGLTVLFACGITHGYCLIEPVFKIRRKTIRGVSEFVIGSDSTIYRNWGKYMDENELPECIYFVVQNGIYAGDRNGRVKFEVRCSPNASRSRNKDKWNEILRAAKKMIPKICLSKTETSKNHQQKLDLKIDRRRYGKTLLMARNYIFSFYDHADDIIPEEIFTIGLCLENIFNNNEFKLQSLTVHGIVILRALSYILRNNATYPPVEGNEKNLEISQLIIAVFFFTNQIHYHKELYEIIAGISIKRKYFNNGGARKEVDTQQTKNIEEFKNIIAQAHAAKQNIDNRVRKVRKTLRQQEFIKILIWSADNHLCNIPEEIIDKSGMLLINNELNLHSEKYRSIGEGNQTAVKAFTLSLAHRKHCADSLLLHDEEVKYFTSLSKKNINIKSMCSRQRLTFEVERREAIKQACQAFNDEYFIELAKAIGYEVMCDIQKNKESLFTKLKEHQIDRLRDLLIMLKVNSRFDSRLIRLSIKFALAQRCSSFADYSSYLAFIFSFIDYRKTTLIERYLQKYRDAEEKYGDNFGEDIFRMKYNDNEMGIQINGVPNEEDYEEFFQTKVIEQTTVEAFQQKFTELKNEVAIFENGKLGFQTLNMAVSHYYKHKEFGAEILTVEQYFDLAKMLFESKQFKPVTILSQDGGAYFEEYYNDSNGAFGVLIRNRVPSSPTLSESHRIMTVHYRRANKKHPDEYKACFIPCHY